MCTALNVGSLETDVATAEGNPDEEKIGAFGVGFYSLFSVTEEPFITSGGKHGPSYRVVVLKRSILRSMDGLLLERQEGPGTHISLTVVGRQSHILVAALCTTRYYT